MESQTKTEWLSNDDLATELNVPLSTVQKWRHYGTGPRAHKLGRHVRYRRSDVEAWLEQRVTPLTARAKAGRR